MPKGIDYVAQILSGGGQKPTTSQAGGSNDMVFSGKGWNVATGQAGGIAWTRHALTAGAVGIGLAALWFIRKRGR